MRRASSTQLSACGSNSPLSAPLQARTAPRAGPAAHGAALSPVNFELGPAAAAARGGAPCSPAGSRARWANPTELASLSPHTPGPRHHLAVSPGLGGPQLSGTPGARPDGSREGHLAGGNPLDGDRVKAPEATTAGERRACRSPRWWLGWAFEFFTAGVAVTDVVTDLMVAFQFRDAGRTGLHISTLCIMAAANILYVAGSVEFGLRGGSSLFGRLGLRLRNWPRVLLYAALLPLGQLLPVINWVCETWWPKPEEEPAQGQGSEQDDATPGGASNQPQIPAGTAEHVVIDDLKGFVSRHYRSHGLFFLETMVESVPQSALQVVAITCSSGSPPSTLQVLSLALSLTSIVSKAYVVSVSFDLSVSAAKFALVAYDVFALFYVPAALLAPGPKPASVPWIPDTPMSTLAAVWFWKTLVVACCGLLASGVSGVQAFAQAIKMMPFRPPGACNRVKDIGELTQGTMCSIFLWLLLFVPALVAAEATKLTLVVFVIAIHEPEHRIAAFYSRVLSFIRSARRDKVEQTERVRHVNHYLATTLPQHVQGYVHRELLRLGRPQQRRREELERGRDHVLERCKAVQELAESPGFTIPALRQLHSAARRESTEPGFLTEGVLGIVWAITGIAAGISSFLSFFYPYLSLFLGHPQGPLHVLCLGGMAASILVIAVTAPSVRRYIRDIDTVNLPALGSPRLVQQPAVLDADAAQRIQRSFWGRPGELVLWSMSPPLPRDVALHVASFVASGDIDVRHLNLADCERIKKSVRGADGQC
eukprot:TRINITY_DN11340_c0_g1_i1.p1 TRINITY_DN11340_c0_g1~~TRINITY_DN11340_c0_g1_i1.p1  ORF type:complete len:801 (+),score=170.71 TRINITY_DN11340_c0_g1_i1:109-2403(+)